VHEEYPNPNGIFHLEQARVKSVKKED